MAPLILMASMNWVSEIHKCLGDCLVDDIAVVESCCTSTHDEPIKDQTKDCCSNEEKHCLNESDCCINELIVLDSTVSEYETQEQQPKVPTLSTFAFLSSFVFNHSVLDKKVKTQKVEVQNTFLKPIPKRILSGNFRC